MGREGITPDGEKCETLLVVKESVLMSMVILIQTKLSNVVEEDQALSCEHQ